MNSPPPLARQVVLAFDTHQALSRNREPLREIRRTDFSQMRRHGLTVRESEVLW